MCGVWVPSVYSYVLYIVEKSGSLIFINKMPAMNISNLYMSCTIRIHSDIPNLGRCHTCVHIANYIATQSNTVLYIGIIILLDQELVVQCAGGSNCTMSCST